MQPKNREEIKALCCALATLETPEKIEALLDDLCTIQELIALSQRLQVARLLSEGTNYNDINRITGVSSATISRVNRCLNYGAGGYETALKALENTQ